MESFLVTAMYSWLTAMGFWLRSCSSTDSPPRCRGRRFTGIHFQNLSDLGGCTPIHAEPESAGASEATDVEALCRP